MAKRTRRIATFCLIGTLAFSGKSMVVQADEIPVAGIDVVLSDYYNNLTNANIEITELLNPIISPYKDMAIAQVSDYINIRSNASEDGTILGKMYNNSIATILAQEGEWYKIQSGSVTGYAMASFFAVGEAVDELAKTVGKRYALVKTDMLNVREAASLDSSVHTLVPLGKKLKVKEELDGWVKVEIDRDSLGYVAADYVELTTEFAEAISLEEEQEKAKEEEKAVKLSIRNKIVRYALQFQGNPYVWGGTSLTRGVDCSGFTQSVLRDNGIRVSRTSRTQVNDGRIIPMSDAQPGDLIFYTRNGTINHVVMYIGNGKVIGASSPKYGIRISDYNYRQPYKVVNYID